METQGRTQGGRAEVTAGPIGPIGPIGPMGIGQFFPGDTSGVA